MPLDGWSISIIKCSCFYVSVIRLLESVPLASYMECRVERWEIHIDQRRYINCVLSLNTLKANFLGVECSLGDIRWCPWGGPTMDVIWFAVTRRGKMSATVTTDSNNVGRLGANREGKC